jgi:hypothetical protein
MLFLFTFKQLVGLLTMNATGYTRHLDRGTQTRKEQPCRNESGENKCFAVRGYEQWYEAMYRLS